MEGVGSFDSGTQRTYSSIPCRLRRGMLQSQMHRVWAKVRTERMRDRAFVDVPVCFVLFRELILADTKNWVRENENDVYGRRQWHVVVDLVVSPRGIFFVARCRLVQSKDGLCYLKDICFFPGSRQYVSQWSTFYRECEPVDETGPL